MSWQFTTPDNRLEPDDDVNLCEDCGEEVDPPKHLCRYCARQREYDDSGRDTGTAAMRRAARWTCV